MMAVDRRLDPSNPINLLDRRVKRLEDKLDALDVEGSLNMTLIEDVVLSVSQATIDFQGIPDHFRHLRIVGLLASDRAANEDFLRVQMNADSGANYDWVWIDARHTIASGEPTFGSNDAVGDTSIELGGLVAASAPASLFTPVDISIPHYTDSSIFKAATLGSAGREAQAVRENLFVEQGFGVWKQAAVITDLKLSLAFGPNFIAGSRATLYALG